MVDFPSLPFIAEGKPVSIGDDIIIASNQDSGAVVCFGQPTTVGDAMTIASGQGSSATVAVDNELSLGYGTSKKPLTIGGAGADPGSGVLSLDDEYAVINAGQVTVQSNSSLMGDGTVICASLNVDGELLPGDKLAQIDHKTVVVDEGSIDISGPLTVGTSGALVVDIATDNSYDVVKVTGTATLAGKLEIRLDNFVPTTVKDGPFTILTASAGVHGEFLPLPDGGAIAGSDGKLKWHVDYSNPNEVILEVVKATGVAVSATAGSSSRFPVATLVGLDPSEDPYLTAEVSYGDGGGAPIDNTNGTSQYGYIDFDGSTATVYGIYGYAKPGIYAVRTTFEINGQEIAIADSKATVADGTLYVNPASDVSFTEGLACGGELATVSGTAATTPDLAAIVDWDNGTTTAAEIVPDNPPDGGCQVWADGMNTYTTTASHTITVTVFDKYGTSASTDVPTTTVQSSNVPPTVTDNISLSAWPNLTTTVNPETPYESFLPLATFTDTDTTTNAESYLR